MEILTTQPGILMYTGNYLHKAVIGKYDEVLDRHAAVCLETQGYPNAVNTVSLLLVVQLCSPLFVYLNYDFHSRRFLRWK